MPFLVKDLIDEHHKPVMVRDDDSLQTALTRMTEHDYSQLPVVDAEDRYLGMVTSDSILRALKTFGVTPASLRVRDARTRVSMFREDDDLFQLLDDLRDSYAVPILDEDKRVVGVVTGYDATEYFRRRTEDMMFVEDIEATLKDYIQASHTNGSGEVNDTTLQQSIQQCARGASTTRKRFFTALQRYLEQPQINGGVKPRLDAVFATEVFTHVFERDAPKSLDQLTFADFVELLTSGEQWPRYAPAFEPLSQAALRTMLDSVRETRNALAHFRAEVTPEQHERLKFCLDWLKIHPASAFIPAHADVVAVAPAPPQDDARPESETASPDAELAQIDAELDANGSRYAPLATYMRSQIPGHNRVTLSFEEVENILKAPLPPYARKHRAFWSNDTVSHPQSRQWLDADWRVASVDMNSEQVIFTRIKAREQAYREFFGALFDDLRAKAPFPVRRANPSGVNWLEVVSVPQHRPVAHITFAWGRSRQLRVGLYLDGREPEIRKQVYDALFAQRAELERELTETWLWDRLEGRKSAYVGVARPYSIEDDVAMQAEARAWAVDTVIRFHALLAPRVANALQEIKESAR